MSILMTHVSSMASLFWLMTALFPLALVLHLRLTGHDWMDLEDAHKSPVDGVRKKNNSINIDFTKHSQQNDSIVNE
jgi:hypothetical protein